MNQFDILQSILKDSSYDLSLFSAAEVANLRSKIIINNLRGKDTPFVVCAVRDKEIQLKPEGSLGIRVTSSPYCF